MTVCDLSCASSVVCAERFRAVAKSFTEGAHTPAVRHRVRVCYQAVLDAPNWLLSHVGSFIWPGGF
jgi:hypothetical protein